MRAARARIHLIGDHDDRSRFRTPAERTGTRHELRNGRVFGIADSPVLLGSGLMARTQRATGNLLIGWPAPSIPAVLPTFGWGSPV
jgi:hypothetical protein